MGRVKRTREEALAAIERAHAAPRTRRGRPEALIQASIVQAVHLSGGVAYSTSQGFRAAPGGTRMTAGIPDLYCVWPRPGLALWIEVKVPGGKLRGAQQQFMELHNRCGGTVPRVRCCRSLDEFMDELKHSGLLTRDNSAKAWRFPYTGGAA